MQNSIFGTRAVRALTGALDGLSRRQNAISDNIANVETPGYQHKAVPFEQELRSAIAGSSVPLAATRPGHLTSSGSSGGFRSGNQASEMLGARNDANSVDLEQEMTDLAETTIRYYAVADALKGKLATLRQVIERS